MEIKDLLSLENYIEWLNKETTNKLKQLNKKLKSYVEYDIHNYLISDEHKGAVAEPNFDSWKKTSGNLIDTVNRLATELRIMRDIPKSDEYQSVKDNYKSESCYSEFLMSIITKVINNDPHFTDNIAKNLTQSIALPIAKDDEPRTGVPKVGAIGVPVVKDVIKSGIPQSADIRFNVPTPNTDELGKRLAQEINKGLGKIRGGLR